MSEFFLELFSEEIPANLQKNCRVLILENFKKLFEDNQIKFKSSAVYSTPNRLIVSFENLEKEIIQKPQEIKGPNVRAPEKAFEGFLRSNKIKKNDVYKKKIEKGEFYFFKKGSQKIKTVDLLQDKIPQILSNISWKKSMKWGEFELKWARPLKSILAIFDGKIIPFKFYHLDSSNTTFVDKEFEDKKKIFKRFKDYKNYFNKLGVLIDHNLRKEYIEKELKRLSNKKNIKIEINKRLLDEVTDLVDQPNILFCHFDKKFLEIPKEILVITMEHHQKYFHTYDAKGNISNEFLVVANNNDLKGLIKIGNERVVEARLSDAQFFWNKNKAQNLVKQVSKLNNINYFRGLGTYFDKVQRMRKLGGIISDEMLISKDKVELSASICKVDLISDLVGEFPELQGIMGGYFASSQGFDKEISLAISEHYLPNGIDSKNPKKAFSIALSLTDKLDTLVGFFGIDQKPTSSKDPFALRRYALSLVRLIVENNKMFKIRDLINYSSRLYEDQGFKFTNKILQKELCDFLTERLKYYMKEKGIRPDIIDAAINSFGIDNLTVIFKKSYLLNKFIDKELGKDIISCYKRASSILENELKSNQIELSNTTDPGIFRNDYEKNLYKNVKDLKKYFLSINKDENYNDTLVNLASSKKVIFDFFDNVIVNDDDQTIKKNRLELLQMLCKTFENYLNFSKIESIK